ncbi:hypothetical protein JCM11641_002276 [Rhodosporidiobolus odoratus]
MRFHCLGVGSIGSLFATNLASLPSTQVRLILRRKDLANQLLDASSPRPRADSASASATPYGSLTVERDGIARRVSNLELELTRSPADSFDTTSLSGGSSSRPSPRIDPRLWNRNDPIETLVVTTKAPQTLPALRQLLPRLSSRSTIVLCQNGMGVLEGLLAKYWPEDRSDEIEAQDEAAGGTGGRGRWGSMGGRPSFVCATTTHGAWRKGGAHFVHAGMGDVKFGVVPNRAVLSTISSYPNPRWESPANNPLLNPRSLVQPTLDHLPYTPSTASLHTTLSSLLSLNELAPSWLPLPTLQIAQLQKLAVNASVNSLTALIGVNNGAFVGSQKAKRVIETVCQECSLVFAAHLAREEGTWAPPPPPETSSSASADDDDDLSADLSSLSFSSHPPPPPLPSSHPLSPYSLLDYTQRVLFKTSSNISSTLSDLLPLQNPHTFSLSENAPSLPSRTEIEYINGYVVALGRRYGIQTTTVKALGELVLLKEEMGRVGAVDRMWASQRRGRSASPSPSSSPSTSSSQPSRSSAASSSPSLFRSSPRSPSPSRSSPPPSSASASSNPQQRAHDRARNHAELRRDNEERAHGQRGERIRGERDREGGG